MKHKGKLNQILEENRGVITSMQTSNAGIPRHILTKLVQEGTLVKVSRGIYIKEDTWEDEMYFLQYRYKKAIFSMDTALYLHGLSDRTPINYHVSIPTHYHSDHLKKENLKITYVDPKYYDLGIIEMNSPCGNKIMVYDMERTLCDIVKGNHACDIHIVNHAMKEYVFSKEMNLDKLYMYAGILRVKKKITTYMEVLL